MVDERRYPKQVFWSDEDEGYIAVASDLPGCSAFGESEEEALAEIGHAIAAWVEAATKAGNPIPAPSRPASEQPYSGKFVLRTSKSLHAQLACGAKREGVSLNHYVCDLLGWAIALKSVDAAAKEIATKYAANVVGAYAPWVHHISMHRFHHFVPAKFHGVGRATADAPILLSGGTSIGRPSEVNILSPLTVPREV